MSDNTIHNVGDIVLNVLNNRVGTVVRLPLDESTDSSNKDRVCVLYENGFETWEDCSQLQTFLVE